MLATFAQLHVGFAGVHGLIGFLIGLIVFIIVAVVLWKIFEILLAKFPIDPSWKTIIYLLAALIMLLVFLQVVGIWTWAN